MRHDELDQQIGNWTTQHDVGDQPHPAAPYRSGSEPFMISEPAPTLGQHNKQVLMELLGLSATDISELETNKIIGTHPLLPD